jgi:modulator of FtsH protease
MARQFTSSVTRTSGDSILATNQVIKNTYILLSLSLIFSAIMAGVAMAVNAPPMGFIMLLGYFGLLMLVNTFRNSALGILFVFALTGFMGFTLGPILNSVINGFSNGTQIVMTSLGGTGVVFLSLSGYALTTRKNFSYLGGFLAAMAMILFVTMIVGFFVQMPMLHLAMSAAVMLFAAGMILFETSNIIHGGETNYIMATVSLYLAIYNLFLSLLHILTALSGRD